MPFDKGIQSRDHHSQSAELSCHPQKSFLLAPCGRHLPAPRPWKPQVCLLSLGLRLFPKCRGRGVAQHAARGVRLLARRIAHLRFVRVLVAESCVDGTGTERWKQTSRSAPPGRGCSRRSKLLGTRGRGSSRSRQGEMAGSRPWVFTPAPCGCSTSLSILGIVSVKS